MDLKGISEIFNLPMKIMVALCIASGLILFLPNNFIDKLYMAKFRNDFGFVIGLIFIITVAIILCNLAVKLSNFFFNKIRLKKLRENRKKFMDNLSQEEKELIKEIDNKLDKTVELPIHNGIIIKLQNANIITPTANEFYVDFEEPIIKFFLQPWVSEYIKENNNF